MSAKAKLLELAVRVAVNKHSGQVDKQQVPYILHPLRVMNDVLEKMSSHPERYEYAMAAVLHDVVEDTDITFASLRRMGFPQTVIDAVMALTKHSNGVKENYLDFVRRAKANPIARVVKLADIQDNLDRIPAKLDTTWWKKLLIKYTVAIHILRDDQEWLDNNRDLVAGLESA